MLGGTAEAACAFFAASSRTREEHFRSFRDQWRRYEALGADVRWLPALVEHVHRREPPAADDG